MAVAAGNQTGNDGGLFGSGSSDSPNAHNGRCDDPACNISNGGRAGRGTDDFDCSRYGNGLKR